jgi:SAM-dependent methyltransferase
MISHQDYFDYLRRRSRLGLFYRKAWLYPRLCSHLRGRVLDIGCGIGDMLRYRPETVGVDVNARNVEWCRSNGLDARPMSPDALPFGEAEFDGAILDNVLEHLSDAAALLAETRRVVRPDGVVIAGVPGVRGYASDPDHKHFYDAEQFVVMFRKAGFRSDRLLAMPLPIPILTRYLRQYCTYGVFTRE